MYTKRHFRQNNTGIACGILNTRPKIEAIHDIILEWLHLEDNEIISIETCPYKNIFFTKSTTKEIAEKGN